MFSTRFYLVSPQRQRSLLTAQPGINAARVAYLRTGFTPPPYRRLARVAMAALWAGIFLVGDLRRVVLDVCVDELLGPQLVALLEVEATGVTERALSLRLAAP